jgi:hypothetical protein
MLEVCLVLPQDVFSSNIDVRIGGLSHAFQVCNRRRCVLELLEAY